MNFREASKNHNWLAADRASIEQINAGSLQRIADATEKVAAKWDALVEERDRYKRYYEDGVTEQKRLARRIFALRGVITRLRRMLGR